MGRIEKIPYEEKENYIIPYRDVAYWLRHRNTSRVYRKYRKILKGRIIEIGCNNGAGTIALARRGAIITGIDINAEAIEIAKESAKTEENKPEFICASFDNLPFPDNYFDGAITFETLEHIYADDIKDIMDELCRVLRVGASVIAIVPLGKFYYVPSHVVFYRPDTFENIFTSSGFEVCECYQDNIKRLVIHAEVVDK